MATIEVGAEVVTSDGKVLGKVKSVESTAFHIDAPRQADYWLGVDVAGDGTAERLELLISEHDVVSYKMDGPFDHNAFQQKGVDPQVLNRQANPRAQ